MKRSALIIFLAVSVAAAIGSFFASAEAVEPPPAYTVPAVFSQAAAGGLHTCGVHTDGAVTCRGNDDFGQSTPPDGIFTQVAAGGFHTCGILQSDGSVVCWGDDSLNQITDTPAGAFTQVSAGEFYTCGILQSDSSVVCWGDNSYNQIIDTPAGAFTQVSAGGNHACGILQSDSSVVCWGYDSSNQVSGTPAGTFTKVEAGGLHTCGILQSDSSVVCWGSGTTNTGSEPEYGQSMPPAGTFADISAGGYHTCGRLSDQSVVCWGAGTTVGVDFEFGQSIPPGGTFSGISAGYYHTCGVRTDQLVSCWGDNSDGQSTMPVYRSVKPAALYVPASADGLGNALVSAAAVSTPDADYYMEYKKTTDTAWTFSGSLERNQIITLPGFGLYQFRVKVVDSTGTLADSAWTAGNQNCVFTDVAAPTGLTATAFSSNQIDLTWDGYVGEDSFELQWRYGAGCDSSGWSTLSTPAADATSDTHSNLGPNRPYSYRIRTFVGGVPSTWSACTTATTPVVPAPTNLAVTGSTYTSVSLSWDDNSNNETKFTLQRKSGAVCDNNGWTVANYPAPDVTAYTDTGRTNGTTYSYRIRTNVGTQAYSSAWSNCVTVTTPLLTAPTGLTANGVGITQIDLGWDAFTGEDSFELQRVTGACNAPGWATIATPAADAVALSNSSLNPGTTYSYRIRAIVGALSSPWSDCASASTSAIQAPANLTLTNITQSSITVNWQDTTTNETSFTIQRKEGLTCGDGGWSFTAAGPNITSYIDTGLPASTTYSYRVRANVGSFPGPWSDCVTATTAASTVPAAPSWGTATAISAASVSLVWNDNSGDETGFQLQRKTGATCDNSGWTSINNPAADVTAFQSNNLATGAQYSYRIRAVNASGNSAWSGCATVTTFAAATVIPADPTVLVATPGGAGSGQIGLSWTDNQGDVAASSETRFQPERKNGACGATGWTTISSTPTNVTTSTNTGTPGATYSYRLRAQNAAGFSGYTNCVTAVAP